MQYIVNNSGFESVLQKLLSQKSLVRDDKSVAPRETFFFNGKMSNDRLYEAMNSKVP